MAARRYVRMSSAAAGSVMVSASSDSTTPGDTVVTRMTGSLSSRRPSVIAHAANLVPQYTAAVGLTSCAPIDATVTRCPAPWRRKCGRTAWIPCRRPRMLTSIIRSHSSAGRGLPPCTPRSGDAGAGRPADDDPTTRHRAASRGGHHPGRAQRGHYVRLEQGRERHPSTQVLAAIADALQLDDDAHQHLFRLAGFTPGLR